MLSPMALGIGYLIGPHGDGCLVPGRVLAYLLIVPVGPAGGPHGFDRGGGCL